LKGIVVREGPKSRSFEGKGGKAGEKKREYPFENWGDPGSQRVVGGVGNVPEQT